MLAMTEGLIPPCHRTSYCDAVLKVVSANVGNGLRLGPAGAARAVQRGSSTVEEVAAAECRDSTGERCRLLPGTVR